MGRYRLTTEEKILKGTLKKSRQLTAPPEFNPYEKVPPAPADLPEYAQQVWIRTAAGLIQYKVLTPLDLESLKAYCYQCHMIEEAQKHLNAEGMTILLTNVKGHSYQAKSPWVSILADATTLCNRIGAQFGLNPAHRSKLQMEIPKKEGKLARLMGVNSKSAMELWEELAETHT